ncbi:uncharacterized protein FMAN_13811 [Fusarium mangiferae]|uniref:Uncharacterized protein n=1 Tax=Fusarium mangiferae TaxID=192010 RepID=A0A1L7TAY4_FUSMA|nr:uncharacterized protein FMAN_13811 [Fusarium mangiferae]CVK95888.1 uncharacterized protein FMAN_13811 [Fusarium mangiferae]
MFLFLARPRHGRLAEKPGRCPRQRETGPCGQGGGEFNCIPTALVHQAHRSIANVFQALDLQIQKDIEHAADWQLKADELEAEEAKPEETDLEEERY